MKKWGSKRDRETDMGTPNEGEQERERQVKRQGRGDMENREEETWVEKQQGQTGDRNKA